MVWPDPGTVSFGKVEGKCSPSLFALPLSSGGGGAGGVCVCVRSIDHKYTGTRR